MFRNMILKKKNVWHLIDGDNDQFLFYLVLFFFILTTTVTLYIEFHLRHSKDGADISIFMLSLFFFYYLISVFAFDV